MQLPLKRSRVTASAVFPACFMDATIKPPKKKEVCVPGVLVLKHLITSWQLVVGWREGERWDRSGDVDELQEGGKPSLAKPQQLLSGEIRHVQNELCRISKQPVCRFMSGQMKQ